MPIGLPVAAYKGADYGAIVYGRGPLFFEALATAMADASLTDFLPVYYQAFKYGVVTTAAFQAFAEAQCACDLSSLFAAWVFP